MASGGGHHFGPPDQRSQWESFRMQQPQLQQHQQQPPVGFNAADIKRFTETFQFARIKAGFSYSDVVSALASGYGLDLDEFTLRKFEDLNLPVSQAVRLKPYLEKWMHSLSLNNNSGSSSSHDHSNTPIEVSSRTSSDSETEQKKPFYGRKRTKIDSKSKGYMESYFKHSQKPNYEELIAISANTGLDRDVVRVWFSNRRQKERRQRDTQEIEHAIATPPLTSASVADGSLKAGSAPLGKMPSLTMAHGASAGVPKACTAPSAVTEPPLVAAAVHSQNSHSSMSIEHWLLAQDAPEPYQSASSCYSLSEGSRRTFGERPAGDGRGSLHHFDLASPPPPLSETHWGTTASSPSANQNLGPFPSTGGLNQSAILPEICGSKTSVIVSRKDQQQKATAVATMRESAASPGIDHMFLMTPKVEESTDRSDEDWHACY